MAKAKELTREQKRARAKCWTLKKSYALAGIDSPLHDHYIRVTQCAMKVFSNLDNELVSAYCGSRVCNVCNRIRTAKCMNEYMPEVQKLFKDMRFVTLTAKAVSEQELPSRINEMRLVFSNISKLRHKKSSPMYGLDWMGLRKLECSYNEDKDWFHPHYHLLIESKATADEVIRQWINSWTRRGVQCVESAQKELKANENSLKEMFKYAVKDCVPTGIKFSAQSAKLIPPQKLDAIYRALSGKRTFQNFGRLKRAPQEEEDLKELRAQSRPEGKEGHLYEWQCYDWVEVNTGEKLADFEPSKYDRNYLGSVFDTDLNEFLQRRIRSLKQHMYLSEIKRTLVWMAYERSRLYATGEVDQYFDGYAQQILV